MSIFGNTIDGYCKSNSLAKVTLYLLKSEVKSFIESGFRSDHIFVDAVVSGDLCLLPSDSMGYEIYTLTEDLIETPDEDKSDRLISLIDEVSYDELEKFLGL